MAATSHRLWITCWRTRRPFPPTASTHATSASTWCCSPGHTSRRTSQSSGPTAKVLMTVGTTSQSCDKRCCPLWALQGPQRLGEGMRVSAGKFGSCFVVGAEMRDCGCCRCTKSRPQEEERQCHGSWSIRRGSSPSIACPRLVQHCAGHTTVAPFHNNMIAHLCTCVRVWCDELLCR